MFFPLGDDNPRRTTPVATIALIAANVLVYLTVNLPSGDAELTRVFRTWGFDSDDPFSVQVLTSMFLHGGLMHLFGNMWVLWIVGDNVEDKLGKLRYLLLYLAGGFAATLAYTLIARWSDPGSAAELVGGGEHETSARNVPLVGASGAIYAVMGIYLVFFPEARIRLLMWIFVFMDVFLIPAKVFLGLTMLLDLFQTIAAHGPAVGGVATAAHVGGGVFGILAALVLKPRVGGGGVGGAWDVHTGFSRSVREGTEPFRGAAPRSASARSRGGDAWFAPPEPMESGARDLADAVTTLVRAGRLREAIDVYPAYAAHRREPPLPPDVQLAVAHEFYRQGLARDGISAYRRFLDTHPADPDAPEAAFRIGLLYARGLNDRRSAAEWLEIAARTHPNPDAAAYAAQELRRLGA